MAARRVSIHQLFVVALLVLAIFSSVTSAAKCYYPKTKASVDPAATAAVQDAGSDTPTVTEAPTLVEVASDEATQFPEVTSSVQSTESTESSNFGQGGSFPSQTSAEGSTGGGFETASPSQSGSFDQGSSLPSQTSLSGSAGGVSQTTSADTSGHATFGDITSQKGGCVIGNPNTFISIADVDDQWDRRMSKYVPTFQNLIFDQIVNNNASLNYCVRWDSTEKLSKSVASKFEAMINRQFKLWNQWLIGYDCWPYEKIDIKVVAFAVRDTSLLDWNDDSLGKIYEGVLDDEGSPKCPDECSKHLERVASADTSACKGEPFDMSLWPSTKVGEGAIGAGGDWGQRVEVNDMLATMDDEQMVVLAHEIGHGFGLPDFYEPTDKPATFPAAVMVQSLTVTDADGWMLRRVLENIKNRYDF